MTYLLVFLRRFLLRHFRALSRALESPIAIVCSALYDAALPVLAERSAPLLLRCMALATSLLRLDLTRDLISDPELF